MRKIRIITDSCADIPEELAKGYDLDFIRFSIVTTIKETILNPYEKSISGETLFNDLRLGKHIYTLPATEGEITRVFDKCISDDVDFIYIACSERQSTSIVKARRIAKKYIRSNPDFNIEIIDSLNSSGAEGLLALEACKMANEGKEFSQIVENIKSLRKKVFEFATVETLSYLSKANKINASSAFMGNLLHIKPILVADVDGNQFAMKKVKGREESISELGKLFLENVENPENQDIIIVHGDDIVAAEELKKILDNSDKIFKDIYVINVCPSVGITTGPGMLGIFGFGKEVTFKEK